MKQVVFHRLTLRGFGRYRDEAAVELDAGLNTLVGQNEEGKSTLVAGLLAVLFGLPDWSDTERFGIGRYRNWHGPSRFEGEVEFSVDGVRYRVERGFDDHRIRLLRREGDGWAEEVTGTHNPNARRRNVHYDERLRELLGLASRELFTATFCVTQPFPHNDEGIDLEVQHLLAGAGGGSYQEALDAIADQLREVTRFSGDRGVHPRNSPQDKRLEQLERERQELARRIEESREAVDSLPMLQGEIEEKRRRAARAEEKLLQARRHREVLEEWLARRKAWADALKEKTRLDRAARDAEGLERDWHDKEAAPGREVPEWLEAPEGAAEQLEQLAGLEQRAAALGEELESTAARLEAVREEAAPAAESALADESGGRRRAAAAWIGLSAIAGLVLALVLFQDAGPAVTLTAALAAGLAGGAAGHFRDAAQRKASADRNAQVLAAEMAAERRVREERCLDLSRQREETEARVGDLRAALAGVLVPVEGDASASRRRHRLFAGLRTAAATAETAFRHALSVLNAASVEDLRQKAEAAAMKALAAQQEMDRQKGEYPGLPEPSLEEDPVALQERAESLREDERRAGAERDRLQDEITELRGRAAALQGREPLNIAAAGEELARLDAERRRLEREADALTLAHQELRAAAESYQTTHRDRLAQAATEHFAALTGVAGRRVVVDDDFRLCVREAGGHTCAVSQLSQGARDQLWLAVRLSVADLLAGEVRPPFIFDDPFLNSDARRLEGIRAMLEELAGERQVLLLSHREEFAAWGRPARLRPENA